MQPVSVNLELQYCSAIQMHFALLPLSFSTIKQRIKTSWFNRFANFKQTRWNPKEGSRQRIPFKLSRMLSALWLQSYSDLGLSPCQDDVHHQGGWCHHTPWAMLFNTFHATHSPLHTWCKHNVSVYIFLGTLGTLKKRMKPMCFPPLKIFAMSAHIKCPLYFHCRQLQCSMRNTVPQLTEVIVPSYCGVCVLCGGAHPGH